MGDFPLFLFCMVYVFQTSEHIFPSKNEIMEVRPYSVFSYEYVGLHPEAGFVSKCYNESTVP